MKFSEMKIPPLLFIFHEYRKNRTEPFSICNGANECVHLGVSETTAIINIIYLHDRFYAFCVCVCICSNARSSDANNKINIYTRYVCFRFNYYLIIIYLFVSCRSTLMIDPSAHVAVLCAIQVTMCGRYGTILILFLPSSSCSSYESIDFRHLFALLWHF